MISEIVFLIVTFFVFQSSKKQYMASSKVHFMSLNTTLLSNLIGKNLIIIAHSLNANVLPRPITNMILLFDFSKDWRMGFLSFVPKSYSWTLCLRFLAYSPWLCNKSANTLFSPVAEESNIFVNSRSTSSGKGCSGGPLDVSPSAHMRNTSNMKCVPHDGTVSVNNATQEVSNHGSNTSAGSSSGSGFHMTQAQYQTLINLMQSQPLDTDGTSSSQPSQPTSLKSLNKAHNSFLTLSLVLRLFFAPPHSHNHIIITLCPTHTLSLSHTHLSHTHLSHTHQTTFHGLLILGQLIILPPL